MKVKFSYSQINALLQLCNAQIDLLKRSIDFSDDADMDKLLIATLEELCRKILSLLLDVKKQYSIKLKPTWGFALRCCFCGMIPMDEYIGAKMMLMCNDIHQHFPVKEIEQKIQP